ncbi:hypothetical protein [Microtetraspora malaysiensis]|uniref:hypothetical protein n=1 Tax=Microtetraspora malaysiensis TaxID=161358 RepID=UPI003D9353F2
MAALAVLAGCGIAPTGVQGGGEPPTGIDNGMRLYFVSDSGLRGVPRQDHDLRDLNGIVKLLMAGPTPDEQRTGLSTLVRITGTFRVSSRKDRVTLRIADQDLATSAQGQLVCSLARGQAVLTSARPDRVEVTIDIGERSAGPYRCSQFLNQG